MRRTLYATLAAFALLAAPAAATPDGLGLAEARWPSVCSGHTTVLVDATLQERGMLGQATGLQSVWDGLGWTWVLKRCEYSVDDQLTPEERCTTDIHEYRHLQTGVASHTGPMDPKVLGPLSERLCGIKSIIVEPYAPEPTTLYGRVRELVRSLLPRPVARWAVTCRVRPAIRCRASSPRAKRVRWFRAETHEGGEIEAQEIQRGIAKKRGVTRS